MYAYIAEWLAFALLDMLDCCQARFTMSILEIGISKANIKEIDKGVKNRWREDWLNEVDKIGKPLSLWCRKLNSPGVAICLLCKTEIRYGKNGKKVLKRHANEDTHQKAVRQQALTQTLPGEM